MHAPVQYGPANDRRAGDEASCSGSGGAFRRPLHLPLWRLPADYGAVIRIGTSYFATEVRWPGVSPEGIAFNTSSP